MTALAPYKDRRSCSPWAKAPPRSSPPILAVAVAVAVALAAAIAIAIAIESDVSVVEVKGGE